jgi:hypothetical protein
MTPDGVRVAPDPTVPTLPIPEPGIIEVAQ